MPELTADTASILAWVIGGLLVMFLLFPFADLAAFVADMLRHVGE